MVCDGLGKPTRQTIHITSLSQVI